MRKFFKILFYSLTIAHVYEHMGFIPVEKNGTGTSTILEYAFDDWAIAQMAQKLSRMNIYNEFIKRSKNYNNVFDSSTGFRRPRLTDGSFKKDFDPLSTFSHGFIEDNS